MADRRTPVVEAVEKVVPSVVNIGTEEMVRRVYSDPRARFRADFYDLLVSDMLQLPPTPGYGIRHSLGSGVIVNRNGYILTNYHVTERASLIRVMLSDEEIYEGTFIAGDEVNDLALIKINAGRPLPAATFAEDDDLLLGETVISIGNPFGLAQTVTVGVLSSKNREARHEGQVLYRDILQTDAAVNPGSSGGPLVNVNGDVIGINVAVHQEGQNIGFAVPIKRARALLNRWLTPKMARKLWFGFDMQQSLESIEVVDIDTNSVAYAQGIRDGDRVAAFEGQPVTDLMHINQALLEQDPAVPVRLRFDLGDGMSRDLSLYLEKVPEPSGTDLAHERLGIVFSERGGENDPNQFRACIAIEEVDEESPAARAALEPGMLITSINNLEVKTAQDVGMALAKVQSGDPVNLQVVSLFKRGTLMVARTSNLQLTAN